MIACYDLDVRLPTYDFFLWATHVRLLGATAITITDGRFYMERKPHLGWPDPRGETIRRRDHYMLPSGPLLGVRVSLGEEGDRHIGTHLINEIWRDAQKVGGVPKMRSILQPAAHTYTVTLRQHWYKPERNSDRATWVAFAEKIGALIIVDHDDGPLGILERMSLYAGARMNFGIPNGPFSILYLTDYPFLEFCDPANTMLRKDFSRHKIAIGDQIPWFGAHQRLVWDKPTLATLLEWFERVRSW